MLTKNWVEYPTNPTEVIRDEGSTRQNTTTMEATHLLLNFGEPNQKYSATNGQQLSEAKHQVPLHPQSRMVVLNNFMQDVTDSQILTQAAENEFVFNYDGTIHESNSLQEKPLVPLQIHPSHNEAIISNGSISSVIQNATPSEDMELELPTEQENDVLSFHNYALSNRTQFLMKAKQQDPLPLNHFRPFRGGMVVSNGFNLQGASSVTDSQIKFLSTQATENEFIVIYDGPELFDETTQVPLQIRQSDNDEIILNGSISSVIQNSTSLEADSQEKLLSEQTIGTKPTQNIANSILPSSAVQTQVDLPTMPFNFVRPQKKVAKKMPLKSILKQRSYLKGGKTVPPTRTTKEKIVTISDEAISIPSSSAVEPLKPRAKLQVNAARTTQINTIRKSNESMKKSSSSVAKPLVPKQINSKPLNKAIVTSNESIVSSKMPILKLPLKRKLEQESTIVKETVLTLPPIGVTITHTYIDGHTESVLLPEISIQRVAGDAERRRFKASFEDVISHNDRLMQILKMNNVTVSCTSNKLRRLM